MHLPANWMPCIQGLAYEGHFDAFLSLRYDGYKVSLGSFEKSTGQIIIYPRFNGAKVQRSLKF